MLEQTLDIAGKDGAIETFISSAGAWFASGCPVPDGCTRHPRGAARYGPAARQRRLFCAAAKPVLSRRARHAFGPKVLEPGSAEHQRMRAVRTKMTIPPVMDDVAAMLAFVDAADGGKPDLFGVHGYCMSGPYALAAAARYPDRVAAAASLLWHLAGQRCGRKPASVLRQGQGRALHRVRGNRRLGATCDGGGIAHPVCKRPAVPVNWRSIRACITALPFLSARSTTRRRPNGTGSD